MSVMVWNCDVGTNLLLPPSLYHVGEMIIDDLRSICPDESVRLRGACTQFACYGSGKYFRVLILWQNWVELAPVAKGHTAAA